MRLVTTQLAPAVPDLQSAAVDAATGRWTPPWAAFFRRFAAGAPPIKAVATGASPLVWTAPGPGDLVIEGGTVLSSTLVRATSAVVLLGGLVPVASGDNVILFFTAAPVVTFIPRVI